MNEQYPSISVDQLRIGLYVYLDLNWLEHPFPLNHFKIESEEQIEIIRRLGLKQIRWSPELSDPLPPEGSDKSAPTPSRKASPSPSGRPPPSDDHFSLLRCEREFAEAAQGLREVFRLVLDQPQQARAQAQGIADSLVQELVDQGESCIRLLSEQAGDRTALHGINVAVIALLLGQRLGFAKEVLNRLTLGALLHDLGKVQLPERLRWYDAAFSGVERKLFQRHIEYGVELAERMGLDTKIKDIIGQHHEYVDGSGFPRGLKGDQMSYEARIVSLVNYYDSLCNPANPVEAVTPHQALSLMFAQARSKFDAQILPVFIRMMGVYPPGSVVVLSDGRYALVVSVNAARPLKPRVLVHDPRIPREEARVLDLEDYPGLSIRQSLKPTQLPRAAFDYLLPRQRICYFFERARAPEDRSGAAREHTRT